MHQEQATKDNCLDDWMFIHQNHALQHQQLSDSSSSLGIRTPDVDISDLMMTTSNSQLFQAVGGSTAVTGGSGGYTSFLQPSPILNSHCTMTDDIQLIPSLTVSSVTHTIFIIVALTFILFIYRIKII